MRLHQCANLHWIIVRFTTPPSSWTPTRTLRAALWTRSSIPRTDAGKHHWDLAKAHAGNLGVEFFSIWVEPGKFKDHETRRALDMIDSVYQVVARNPDEMVMATGTRDIYAARKGPKKRIAVLMGVEGGHAIENDVARTARLLPTRRSLHDADVGEFDAVGAIVRRSSEARRKWQGSDPGLTDPGRNIVREMNRLGMMVDISHVSDRSFFNALTVSRAPVIASHSSSRAITDVPRNMTDDMLIALARNGGVAQVNFNCGFISSDYNKAVKQYENDHPEYGKQVEALGQKFKEGKASLDDYSRLSEQLNAAVPRPPFSALIDHFDHMIKVAGVEHVGIGSDFDGVPCLPQGIDSVADLPKITEALMQRGYTAADMQKVLGGNLLRVFADVERVAKEMQSEKNPDSRKIVALPGTESKK